MLAQESRVVDFLEDEAIAIFQPAALNHQSPSTTTILFFANICPWFRDWISMLLCASLYFLLWLLLLLRFSRKVVSESSRDFLRPWCEPSAQPISLHKILARILRFLDTYLAMVVILLLSLLSWAVHSSETFSFPNLERRIGTGRWCDSTFNHPSPCLIIAYITTRVIPSQTLSCFLSSTAICSHGFDQDHLRLFPDLCSAPETIVRPVKFKLCFRAWMPTNTTRIRQRSLSQRFMIPRLDSNSIVSITG